MALTWPRASAGKRAEGVRAKGDFDPFIDGGDNLGLAAMSREGATEGCHCTLGKGKHHGLGQDGALVDHRIVLGMVAGIGVFGNGGKAMGTVEPDNSGFLGFGLLSLVGHIYEATPASPI